MKPFNGNVFSYDDINFLRNSINKIIPHGSELQEFVDKGVEEENHFKLLLIAAATISFYGLNDKLYNVLEPYNFLEYGTVLDLLTKAYKSNITDESIMIMSLYFPTYKIKEALTII